MANKVWERKSYAISENILNQENRWRDISTEKPETSGYYEGRTKDSMKVYEIFYGIVQDVWICLDDWSFKNEIAYWRNKSYDEFLEIDGD